MDTIANSDPSGFLPAALAAVKLVGAVAKVAPHVKHAVDTARNNNAGPGANAHIGTDTSRTASQGDAAAPASLQVDPERENRAYETVNYVLRTLGNRIGEAGLVSAPALAKALTAASTHIEVELFSVNANRLFKSLAAKLKDAVLVNSVFTSIYFIGAITAELSRSLPNYKTTYPPLGPFIIQQMFRAAIGEDAFRENMTANLDAYKTLATTAGLLRPTDIGYSIFPDFPSLSPTRYSSKSYTDVRTHKNIFDRLIKHFDMHGFPQPLPGHDVGPIKDWRFLSGDANSRWYEVDRADKHIGEAIGRVLYWLINGADRMPAGMGVIAYYKQHIELIQWMGTRFGYRVLNGATDLDLSGPHLRLENKYRATIEAWVIIMPSESGHTTRRQSSAHWSEVTPPTPISPQTSNASNSHRPSLSSSVSSTDTLPPYNKLNLTTTPQHAAPHRGIGIGSTISHAGAAARRSESYPKPAGLAAGISALSSPATPAYTETPAQIPSPTIQPAAMASPSTQSDVSTPATPAPTEHSTAGQGAATNTFSPPQSSASSSLPAAPPSYFPPIAETTSSNNVNPSQPLMVKRPASAVRRKAPPPPPKFTPARALYDFAPEEEGGEELTFYEGAELEIVQKSEELEADGWCKARIKGTTIVGLAPLDYLEERKPPPRANPPRVAHPPAAAPGHPAHQTAAMPPSSVPYTANVRSVSGGPNAHGPQAAPLSRGLGPPAGATRPHSVMQPHLTGIHENLQIHEDEGLQLNHISQQTPTGRPHSIAVQNQNARLHSNIPVNPQMQHNPYAHPVQSLHPGQSAHPTTATQQSSNAPQGSPSLANQAPRPSPNPMGASTSPAAHPSQPQPSKPSASGPGVQQRPSNPNSGPPSQQPSSRPPNAQQGPPPPYGSNIQQSLPVRYGSAAPQGPNLRPSPALSNPTIRQPPGSFNFAPSLSLNLSGRQSGSRPGNSNTSSGGATHNHPSSNNYGGTDNSQSYNDPNAGYNGNQNMQNNAYNPNYANYGGNPNMYAYNSNSVDPNSYSGDDLGLSAGAGVLAGVGLDAAGDSGVDPASFMGSVTDFASIDPFYASMNPGVASAGPSSPTSFLPDTTDSAAGADSGGGGAGDLTSPLAGLAPGGDGNNTDLSGTASDAPGGGGFGGFMESPLAGLAPPDENATDFSGAGGDGADSGMGNMTSPLAGLAPGDSSQTGLGLGGDDGSYDQTGTTTTYMESDTGSNGDQSSMFMQEDDTTSASWGDMGDGSDDGFGYS